MPSHENTKDAFSDWGDEPHIPDFAEVTGEAPDIEEWSLDSNVLQLQVCSFEQFFEDDDSSHLSWGEPATTDALVH